MNPLPKPRPSGRTESPRWILRFDPGDASALARVRLVPGLEIAQTPEALWLRTTPEFTVSEASQRLLSSLPASARYHPLPNQALRPTDRILSHESLPNLTWIAIDQAFALVLPQPAWPAAAPQRIPLRLVPSRREIEANAAMFDGESFYAQALQAPLLRLERLRFAAADTGQVLVIGTPLPPLPGTRFSLHAGVAIPAGFTWSPHVAPEVLARCLKPPPDGLALWTPDGHLAHIHPEQILPVTRSTIRGMTKSHPPLTTHH